MLYLYFMCLAVTAKIPLSNKNNPDIKMCKIDFEGTITNECIEWLKKMGMC